MNKHYEKVWSDAPMIRLIVLINRARAINIAKASHIRYIFPTHHTH